MTTSATFQKQYGPWALVAGASEGLGAAYADQLAYRGLNLVLVARRENLLQALARELQEKYSVEVKTIVLDLSQPDSAEVILEKTSDLEIGLLIYNAAFSAVGPFLERSISDHLKEIDTNIRTPLALIYHFGQRLLTRGHGGIILMASLSAFQGSAFISNYAATKAFNMLLAEGLWEEWRKQGIDALVCIAGAIRTSNYLASTPKQTSHFSATPFEPEYVAREALAALGRRPYIIPGRSNRLASFFMHRLLPRFMAIKMMGRILRDMYG